MADGSDLVMVYAYIRSSSGYVVTTATNNVSFSVSGQGSITGASSINAEAGIAGALLKTTKTPGTITVTASASGLTPGGGGDLPWLEDFSSEPGGRFSINQETRTWTSESIDISGAGSVSISAEIEGDNAQVMESADYLNLYYQVDGGSQIAWSQDTDGFTLKTVSISGLSGNTGEWWKVDPGSSYNLSGSQVMWEFDGRVIGYIIEVSTDNSTWTTVVDKQNNSDSSQVQNDSFSATAQYVRITVTSLPSSTWASFFEFEVYGN